MSAKTTPPRRKKKQQPPPVEEPEEESEEEISPEMLALMEQRSFAKLTQSIDVFSHTDHLVTAPERLERPLSSFEA